MICYLGKFHTKTSVYSLFTYKLYTLHGMDTKIMKIYIYMNYFYCHIFIIQLVE